MTTATLSYKDQFAWGLRINPSYDELLQSTQKKIKYHLPDRSAKWFANSVYRSFMVDAARKYHDYEHLQLDYDQSEARLPRAVAMVQPAAEGQDPEWERMRQATQQAEDHDFIEQGFATMEAERRREAAQMRRQQLADQAAAAFTAQQWYIGENDEDMEQAGVEHDRPMHMPQLSSVGLPAPVHLPVAAGHVGALRPFPTFQELNYGPVRQFRNPIVRIRPQDTGYERMRDSALGQR